MALQTKLMQVGGGGLQAGGPSFSLTTAEMLGAVGSGYAAVNTDAGHESAISDDWVLTSPVGIPSGPLFRQLAYTSGRETSTFHLYKISPM